MVITTVLFHTARTKLHTMEINKNSNKIRYRNKHLYTV